jgi:uncharacterized protein (DUF1778 family)
MRLDEETYKKLKAAAAAERRSLANLIETAALRHLEDSEFVDDIETRDILSDPDLLKRLRSGHLQARKRKGAFVRGL